MKHRSQRLKPILTVMTITFVVVFFIIASQATAIGAEGAPLLVDDFQDGEKADFWYLNEENPDNVWLDETNGRLEGRSSETCDEDALYLSRRWRLSVDHDFAMQIDWHHSSTSSESHAFLGVSNPGAVENSININLVYNEDGALFAIDGETAGVEVPWNPISRATTDGTVYLAYDSDSDQMYMSINGYWRAEDTANGDWVFEGLVQDTWDAEMLAVHFGFWAETAVIDTGEVWLDNFKVMQGTIVTPSTKQVTVDSSPNQGLTIGVRPEDNDDTGNGTTPFTRTYDVGIPVFLTAPADDGQGNNFARWELEGEPWSTHQSVELSMDVDHSVNAVYTQSGISAHKAMPWIPLLLLDN